MQVSNCNIMYKVATQCVCVCVCVYVCVCVCVCVYIYIYIYIYIHTHIYTWSKLQVTFFQDSEISDEQKAQNYLFDIETFKILNK